MGLILIQTFIQNNSSTEENGDTVARYCFSIGGSVMPQRNVESIETSGKDGV